MRDMFTRDFWSEALQRSVRTFAQTFISIVGVSSFSVWSLDWKETIGVSLGAAVIALLMAVDRSTAATVIERPVVVEVEQAPGAHGPDDSLR